MGTGHVQHIDRESSPSEASPAAIVPVTPLEPATLPDRPSHLEDEGKHTCDARKDGVGPKANQDEIDEMAALVASMRRDFKDLLASQSDWSSVERCSNGSVVVMEGCYTVQSRSVLPRMSAVNRRLYESIGAPGLNGLGMVGAITGCMGAAMLAVSLNAGPILMAVSVVGGFLGGGVSSMTIGAILPRFIEDLESFTKDLRAEKFLRRATSSSKPGSLGSVLDEITREGLRGEISLRGVWDDTLVLGLTISYPPKKEG